jgi:hypothetical protein
MIQRSELWKEEGEQGRIKSACLRLAFPRDSSFLHMQTLLTLNRSRTHLYVRASLKAMNSR